MALTALTALMTQRMRVLRWLIALAGVAWAAQSLDTGLLLDDRGHRRFVEDQLARGTFDAETLDMFGVWRSADASEVRDKIERGVLPWWSSPGFSLSFLRPLAVATHYLDYGLWPASPPLAHAHNLAWYLAMLLLLGALYHRWLGEGMLAVLALLLFALDDAHVAGAAWLAGRNTLMTAVFVIATLLAHHHARSEGAPPRARAYAPLLLLLGFASSEGAIAAWAYLVPHAIWLDRGPVRARLLALAPMGLATLAYQLLYRALGHGVRGSALYMDPGREPLHFAAGLLERYPIALKQQFAFAELLGQRADLISLALFTACVCLTLWLSRDRRLTRFLLTGTLLAALPLCTVVTTPRLLFPLSIGGAALLAHMLIESLAALRRGPLARRAAGVLVAAPVVAVHVAAAALAGPLAARALADLDAGVTARVQTLPWGPQLHGATLVIVHAPDLLTAGAGVQERSVREAGPARIYLIGTGERPVRVERTGEHALRLVPEDGYLAQPWAWMSRAQGDRFELGERVELIGLTITIEAITQDGRPAALTLRWEPEARPVWVRWEPIKQRYRMLVLPPLGESIVINEGAPPTPVIVPAIGAR